MYLVQVLITRRFENIILLLIYIMSGVCKNLNKISQLIKSQKFGRATFAGTSFKDRGFSPAVVNE